MENMEKNLFDIIRKITPVNDKAIREATKRQENLAKPPGALGELEAIAIKLAGITGKIKNEINKEGIIICSSDNGILEEGVSPTPQSVTFAQTINFTRGLTGVSAIANGFNIDLCVIDLGVNGIFPPKVLTDKMEDFSKNLIVDRKLAMGSYNFTKGPAMTREMAIKGIMVGIEATDVMKSMGYDIVGTGEMGIGNTTTTSSLLVGLTGCDPEKAVGRGGGLNDRGYERKLEIVRTVAYEKEFSDVLDILSNVGGFDICGLVGVFLGCGKNKIPVVIDGYISAVAALCAIRMAKEVDVEIKDYMFTSHISAEGGYEIAMEHIGLKGILNLGMRLGEGSGCPLAFQLIKGAVYAMNNMGTYDEAQIDENYLDLISDAKF